MRSRRMTSGKTSMSYMMPVRQRGVPYAFVVGKDGRLLWYGHPLHGLDQALDRIVAGRYNVERRPKQTSPGSRWDSI